MKKKIFILLFITLFAAYGCTKVPNSVDTGMEAGQYKGENLKELTEEYEILRTDLEVNIKEIEKLTEENLKLKEANDEIKKELEEAKSLLNLLQNEELPKFTTDKTDKESILNYLNEIKAVLSDRSRDIEIVEQKLDEDKILFVMVGYNNDHNQFFVWEVGKSEPSLIDGAYYYNSGNYKWLLEDKYIIINKGKSDNNENLVVDLSNLKVINSFEAVYDDIYLIPDTASIIMKKSELENKLLIYNFINNEEKEIEFDFQNNNLEFEVKNGEIIFSGYYKDSYDVEYTVQATVSIDKFKERYEISSLEEALKGNQEETDNEEGKSEDRV